MTLDLVEGWTERITYQLTADGATQVLSGMTVALDIFDRRNVQVAVTGASGIVDAATGKVYFDPNPADLVSSKSPYYVRWKVTDGSGKVAFFPNAAVTVWNVRKP